MFKARSNSPESTEAVRRLLSVRVMAVIVTVVPVFVLRCRIFTLPPKSSLRRYAVRQCLFFSFSDSSFNPCSLFLL